MYIKYTYNPKHTACLFELYLTSDPSTFTFTTSAPLRKSDHSLIKINFPFDLSKPKIQHINRRIWLFHRADLDVMRRFFGQFPWNDALKNKTSECVPVFEGVIQMSVEQSVPYVNGKK